MKYLVTGGSGFIGSTLVKKLLEKPENRVIVIDGHNPQVHLYDQAHATGKYANLPLDTRLTVYDTDIMGNITELFKGIDVVFHLAAYTRPQWSIQFPYETMQANVNGTIKILEHVRDNKVGRFVFISTSNLYGNQDKEFLYEWMTPKPMNAYALSKWFGEESCKLFALSYGVKFNIIRPFNVYGKNAPITGYYTSAVATFINVLKNNLPLEMFGTGRQKRDFVHVDDLVDLMIVVSQSKAVNEIFNCGLGKYYSINHLYRTICKIMKKKIEPVRYPAQFEPKNTLANMDFTKRTLNWKPKIDLEEGLRRTING